MQAFAEIIANVITKDEGGWVLSQDADGGDGGWTFGGITKKTYDTTIIGVHDGFVGVTYEQIKKEALAQSEWFMHFKNDCCNIYKFNFWDKMYLDLIHEDHQEMMFSCGINRGPANAIKALQTAIGIVVADGIWGTDTANHYNSFIHDDTFHMYFCRAWMHQYFEICKHIPEKIQYLSGWYNRVERFR